MKGLENLVSDLNGNRSEPVSSYSTVVVEPWKDDGRFQQSHNNNNDVVVVVVVVTLTRLKKD